MAKELIYSLTDPGYTIYHRAALGGLAATIRAWRGNPPEGIEASVDSERVRLAWGDDITDQNALKRILADSFRITKDGMIELVGHNLPQNKQDLRLAIHNGLCATFLQHNKMRPGIPGKKEAERIELRSPDDETGALFTYKAVTSYAHQSAQGTGLFDEKVQKGAPTGVLPKAAAIPQSVVPGAMKGMREIEGPAQDVFLLLYLMVGSSVFLLRSRSSDPRMQACVVVPDVVNLEAFADTLEMALPDALTDTYLKRVVGSAEEGALRFLLDMDVRHLVTKQQSGVAGCLAVTMGKVAWDKNQVNRTSSLRISLDARRPELGIFKATVKHPDLGGAKILNNKKGEGFAVPRSPLPGLVAANFGAENHWATNFRDLVKDTKGFRNIRFARRGLQAMNEAIRDEDDKAIIHAFHDAWKHKMRAFGEREERERADFNRSVEREQDRMRNAILRAKTADALAAWFLRFCADSTKGKALPAMQTHGDRIRRFIFDRRNAERFQNLLLFALVSYAGKDSKTTSEEKA